MELFRIFPVCSPNPAIDRYNCTDIDSLSRLTFVNIPKSIKLQLGNKKAIILKFTV
jgi:hypothetical protein